MELLVGTQSCFPKNLLLSASILALWPPQGSQAALHIQKIPEQPQKNQDLLLFLEGVPDSFQDFTWYLGEEPHGGTMLFTYIPGLQRPQRDGNAMGQRDAVGFRNGSMLLRRVQPSDSGTYHVAVTVNPAWTMRAKTEVQVAEKHQQLPAASLPVGAGILAAAVLGSLAAGFLLVGSLAYLLVTRGWRGRSPRYGTPGASPRSQSWTPARRPVSHKPGLTTRPWRLPSPGDNNVYEVMPSPVLLVSPLSDLRPMSPAMVSPTPMPSPKARLLPWWSPRNGPRPRTGTRPGLPVRRPRETRGLVGFMQRGRSALGASSPAAPPVGLFKEVSPQLSQVPLSPGGQVPWGWCLWSSPSPVCQGLPLGVTCWVTPTSPTSRVP
uniref:Immunoglobulin V-set domain-containing protein n=1 Tax=Sciurus vulgaris TaxID=55149 RepID=A0A8D2DE46_SCIVU